MNEEEFEKKFDKVYRRKRRAEAIAALTVALGLLWLFFSSL